MCRGGKVRHPTPKFDRNDRFPAKWRKIIKEESILGS